MEIFDGVYLQYIRMTEEKVKLSSILEEAQSQLDNEITDIPTELLDIVYRFLYSRPENYWDKSIEDKTYTRFSEILDEYSSKNIPDIAWNYFFIAYNSFKGLTRVMNDMKNISESEEMKTRLYRIPTYVNIVEGCISNIYKFILNVLNEIVDGKDYSKQNKLNSMCEALSKNNLEELTKNVDVDIRNAINHGGILVSSSEIIFQYYKNNSLLQKKLKTFEFDSLIDKVYDTFTGIFMGIIRYLVLNPEIIRNIDSKNEFNSNELNKLKLTIPGNECKFIEDAKLVSQINMHFEVEAPSLEKCANIAIKIAIISYSIFPEYSSYFIGFRNDRMFPSFFRFSKENVEKFIMKEYSLDDLYNSALNSQNVFFGDVSDEKINEFETKFYRYPSIKEEDWHINNICCISLENKKRLKACLFINSIKKKNEIKDIIKKAIEILKGQYNPPSLSLKIKHGDMEADMIFMTVFIEDMRKNKELLLSNDNFIASVQYAVNREDYLKEGGVFESLWNSYSKEYEGKNLYAWNPNYLKKCNYSGIP